MTENENNRSGSSGNINEIPFDGHSITDIEITKRKSSENIKKRKEFWQKLKYDESNMSANIEEEYLEENIFFPVCYVRRDMESAEMILKSGITLSIFDNGYSYGMNYRKINKLMIKYESAFALNHNYPISTEDFNMIQQAMIDKMNGNISPEINTDFIITKYKKFQDYLKDNENIENEEDPF